MLTANSSSYDPPTPNSFGHSSPVFAYTRPSTPSLTTLTPSQYVTPDPRGFMQNNELRIPIRADSDSSDDETSVVSPSIVPDTPPSLMMNHAQLTNSDRVLSSSPIVMLGNSPMPNREMPLVPPPAPRRNQRVASDDSAINRRVRVIPYPPNLVGLRNAILDLENALTSNSSHQ